MANSLIKAVKTQHFSPKDDEVRRSAMLNDLVSDVRILAQAISSVIGTGLAGPSNSVILETAFAQTPSAGVASAYSRGDHTHGTPDFPTITEDMTDGSFVTVGDFRSIQDLTQELFFLLRDLELVELGQAPQSWLVG